jgi:hypothetical protein
MKNKLQLKWEPKKYNPADKRYIAIVFISRKDFDDDYNYIAQHITSWTEVTEEEFTILQKVSYETSGNSQFLIIERPINESLFAKNTVQDYIEFSKNKIQRDKEWKLKREQSRIKKEKKSKLEKEKRDKELFEQLKQKFEK